MLLTKVSFMFPLTYVTDKEGIISLEAFFEILFLNGICLSDVDKINLSHRSHAFSQNGKEMIKYKDALKMVNQNQED